MEEGECTSLTSAFRLQLLRPDHIPQHLLAGADGLVPRARGAVGVVLGDGAGGREREGAGLGRRLRRVVLGGRGLLLLLAGALVRRVACQGAEAFLHGALGCVDGGLEGRGLVAGGSVGHGSGVGIGVGGVLVGGELRI